MNRGAFLSSCERYRFHLWREWREFDDLQPVRRCCFIMLNPSTADANIDDPTIRKCMRFTSAWGYNRLDVVNLFAYRATDPKELTKAHDPIGVANDTWIGATAAKCSLVVCAWGNGGHLHQRGKEVLRMLYPLPTNKLAFLGSNKDGSPKHPLYLPNATKLNLYWRTAS